MGGGREAMPQLETRKSQMGKLTGKAFGFDLWVGKIPWRREWQPIPVFLPGEFHGWRSLVGYSPWGHKESDKTERLSNRCLMHHKEEAQAGIKIARRDINNLRYADDTTLMAESEEELKSLLIKVKVKSLSHVRLFATDGL